MYWDRTEFFSSNREGDTLSITEQVFVNVGREYYLILTDDKARPVLVTLCYVGVWLCYFVSLPLFLQPDLTQWVTLSVTYLTLLTTTSLARILMIKLLYYNYNYQNVNNDSYFNYLKLFGWPLFFVIYIFVYPIFVPFESIYILFDIMFTNLVTIDSRVTGARYLHGRCFRQKVDNVGSCVVVCSTVATIIRDIDMIVNAQYCHYNRFQLLAHYLVNFCLIDVCNDMSTRPNRLQQKSYELSQIKQFYLKKANNYINNIESDNGHGSHVWRFLSFFYTYLWFEIGINVIILVAMGICVVVTFSGFHNQYIGVGFELVVLALWLVVLWHTITQYHQLLHFFQSQGSFELILTHVHPATLRAIRRGVWYKPSKAWLEDVFYDPKMIQLIKQNTLLLDYEQLIEIFDNCGFCDIGKYATQMIIDYCSFIDLQYVEQHIEPVVQEVLQRVESNGV